MRILIEFLPYLGDFVTQLPILHALHERIRPLDVEVIVSGPSAELLEDYDWVGRNHVRGSEWRSRLDPLASSYRKPFDLLLYLRSHPAIKLNRMLVRARRKLGAEAYDEAASARGVVRHRYSILERVLTDGLPEIATRVVLRPERAGAAFAAAGFAAGARILCLGPGASTPRRRWPVRCFAELAQSLSGQFDGIAVVGSPPEAEMCADLARRAGGVSLAGQPLGVVAALLARSALYLGNDSGLVHLAAAQGCPAVSIGHADPYYTPWKGYAVPGRAEDLSAAEVLAFLEANVVTSAAGGGANRPRAAADALPASARAVSPAPPPAASGSRSPS